MNILPQAIRLRLTAFAAAAFPLFDKARDKLRGSTLLLIGVGSLWLIATPNPLTGNGNDAKAGLLAWLICREAVMAYLCYWIDRLLHPRSRPGDLRDIERMAAEKRRAFIVCAGLLAGGLFP